MVVQEVLQETAPDHDKDEEIERLRFRKVIAHWRRFVQIRRQAAVCLYSFRGVRTVYNVKVADVTDVEARALIDSECRNERRLYTGHVGFSLDHGRTIYGWNRIIPACESTFELAIGNLKTGRAYPGILKDDTHVFDAATAHYRRHGWNTRVATVTIAVTPQRWAQLQTQLHRLYQFRHGEHGWKYSFPRRTRDGGSRCGYFEDDHTANCATFPHTFLGLQTCADRSGRMFSYAGRCLAESALLELLERVRRVRHSNNEMRGTKQQVPTTTTGINDVEHHHHDQQQPQQPFALSSSWIMVKSH